MGLEYISQLFLYSSHMKSAIVHEWLTSLVGGSENCLKEIHSLFPSPIFSLICDRKALQGSYFEGVDIHSSFIEKFPFAKKRYRNYLPLFPLAIEQFDLSAFDLVISSSHCVAKGVLTHPHQLHICHCYTPMRYAWDMTHEYLKDSRGLKGALTKLALHYLRGWDASSAKRVDHFVAISHYVARRIEKFYGRKSTVIYSPANTDFYTLREKKEDFYVAAGRCVPYKKLDLVVEAFSEMPDKKLIVIGDGPDLEKMKSKAKKNIEILGYAPDVVLRDYLQRAKGFVFGSLEDLGLLPIEAMATGTPVIAFGKGGARETIVEHETGLFFPEQTAASIKEAVLAFERREWDPRKCRARAEKFSTEVFRRQFQEFVTQKYQEFIA